LRAEGLKLGENGRRALVTLLAVYVACFAVGCLGPLSAPPAPCGGSPEYPLGNITVVNTPVDIVRINKGQIPVGQTWTYTYKLEGNRTYHIYLLGDWANPTEHKTDYDIIVYRVAGRTLSFVSSHTEAAGLPEQVWNDLYGRYFTPSWTGVYYISVVNDPRESSAAEAGTLMAIEHIETDRWYSRYMHGKIDERPVRDTNWAYEFDTSASRIRVYVDVPSSLDMYEVRLYIMANPSAGVGGLLNGIPVAWEPGLRGERKTVYGGFNFDPQGFRNMDAMASCEHNGEDMVIDYVPPVGGNLLYHLVLIAEYFDGTVEFIVQTDFDPPTMELIDPPDIAEAGEPTALRLDAEDGTAVDTVSLRYSTDGGVAWKQLDVLEHGDGIYEGMVPAFGGGTSVDYVFEAVDALGNAGVARGNFTVMSSPSLELHLDGDEIMGGESVTAHGRIDGGEREVEITYRHGDAASFTVTTDGQGRFNHAFAPDEIGDWRVSAHYAGDGASRPASSETLSFAVSSRPTNLTCVLSREKVEVGKEVTISGRFSLEIAGLRVRLSAASSTNVTSLQATTSADGGYSVAFKPDSRGTWKIRAEVQGDGFRYEGAESSTAELEVTSPRLTTRVIRLTSALLRPPYLYGLLGGAGGMVGVTVFFYMRRE